MLIAGTIGHSSVIDALVSSGWLNVSAVKGNWESFTSQLVKNPVQGCPEALVVAGSDPRGTIYGIYDVSEQIGVSPWYFWADVPPKKKPDIFVLPAAKVQNSPSVKFRGFFLNDEQPALTNWVAQVSFRLTIALVRELTASDRTGPTRHSALATARPSTVLCLSCSSDCAQTISGLPSGPPCSRWTSQETSL